MRHDRHGQSSTPLVLIAIAIAGVAILAFMPGSNPVKDVIENNFFIDDDEHAVSLWTDIAHTIPTSSFTWMEWDQEANDPNGMFNAGSDASNVSIKADGDYRVTATVSFQGDAAGVRGVAFYVNGTFNTVAYTVPVGTIESAATLSRTLQLGEGSTVGVRVYQSTGSDLDLNVFKSRTYFEVIQE